MSLIIKGNIFDINKSKGVPLIIRGCVFDNQRVCL